MERKGRFFIFSAEEQERFSVDEVVPVESAIDTAMIFMDVASGLQMRAEQFVGDTSRAAQNRRVELLQRSSELQVFSSAIKKACAPSETDQFINDTLGR